MPTPTHCKRLESFTVLAVPTSSSFSQCGQIVACYDADHVRHAKCWCTISRWLARLDTPTNVSSGLRGSSVTQRSNHISNTTGKNNKQWQTKRIQCMPSVVRHSRLGLLFSVAPYAPLLANIFSMFTALWVTSCITAVRQRILSCAINSWDCSDFSESL